MVYGLIDVKTLGFNSLPAAFDPFAARATHYITCPNSTQLDDQAKSDKQFCDDWFALLAYKPGVHQYRWGSFKYYVIHFLTILDPLPLHVISFPSKIRKKLAWCNLSNTPTPPKLDYVYLNDPLLCT